MPAAKPPPRQPTPEPEPPPERTDPAGPSLDALAQARQEAAPAQPGPGDSTLVYDKSKGRPRSGASEPPRLAVIGGPRKGAEVILTEGGTTSRSGEGNRLVIPRSSVWRTAVRLA